MKLALTILAIVLYACSVEQEHYMKSVSQDSLQQTKAEEPECILIKEHCCEQINLSHQFDIKIDFKRYQYRDTMYINEPCILKVFIKDKKTKLLIDTFSITSELYYSNMFLSCDSMTSYTTGFKADRVNPDNYFGDIVVDDVNFDGYDDIAIVNDSGGNSGPFYSFYVQNGNKKFNKDNYLTDSVTFFPSVRNSKNKTLTTCGHAGAGYEGVKVYKLNAKKNTWSKISDRRIRI